jgi:hypothetical protein
MTVAVQEKNIKKQKNSPAEKTRNHLREKPSRKEKCRKETPKPDDNANNSTFS